MALFHSADIHRASLPEDLPFVEPGDWIEISTGYTAALRKRIGRRAYLPDPNNPLETTFDYAAWKQALCEEIIKGWSDAEPVSPDSIGQLHPLVLDFIVTEFDRLSAGRTDDEKKESGSNSSPGQAPETASSPASSATS